MRYRRFFTPNLKQASGYILPATIMLSLGIAILSVMLLQYTATTSQTLNNDSYQAFAREAATAGATYVDSCVQSGNTSWTTLTPQTDCSGTVNGGSAYIVQRSGEWQTSFSVSSPTTDPTTGMLTATSTGTVDLLNGSTKVQSFTAVLKITLPSTTTTLQPATGNVITAINNTKNDCAIANGKLYCWGPNTYGQIGDGTPTTRYVPTLVGGALAGKTVTQVSVAEFTVCAVADGQAYCWGRNDQYQLGTGNNTNQSSPIAVGGSVSGKKIMEISTGSTTNPVAVYTSSQNSCALTDGVPYCWGGNDSGQAGQYNCTQVIFWFCGIDKTVQKNPVLVYGYTSGDGDHGDSANLYGLKLDRLAAGSQASCAITNGQQYCWGIKPPVQFIGMLLPPTAYTPYSLQGSNSGGFIDPASWQFSINAMCNMNGMSLMCGGASAAVGSGWLFSYVNPPSVEMSTANVTSNDNGDNIDVLLISDGIYCTVDSGVPKCAGTTYTGTGSNNQASQTALVDNGAGTGVNGKIATAIAAGNQHGCVVANGQLLCWGYSPNGQLADNNSSNHSRTYATVTGNGVIGTASGVAADGAIAVGDNHGCGVANGRLYCWGLNSSGQLGTGNNTNQSMPTAVTMSGQVFNKVSAGANHTCGLTGGKLYCWGSNSNGQLGVGDTTNRNTPTLVNGVSGGGITAGMRVTDVSAGPTQTCAIANGQAYCWGLNSSGQLGQNNTTQYTVPKKVNGFGDLTTSMNVTSITTGTNHSCAVASGDAFCWGNNTNGQLGLGNTTSWLVPKMLTGGTIANSYAPSPPVGMRHYVSKITAGNNFTCAIISSVVSCWGNNANGRTGRATTSGNTTSPTVLAGSPGGYYATDLSAGDSHACAVLNGNSSSTNGNLFCWGAGANGRLGNGGTSDISTAAVINTDDISGKSTLSVSAGLASTCSVSNGDILCWGGAANGRLGNNDIVTDRLTPDQTSAFRLLGAYTKGNIY